MAKCFKCGDEKADTYRYCSARKEFVCINCERACPNYSRKLLSNGTNCRLSGVPLKLFRYLANSEDVKALLPKFDGFSLHQLKGLYSDTENSYRRVEDPETRAKLRVRLAALDQLIENYG